MTETVRVMQVTDFGVIKSLIPAAFADLFTRESGQRHNLPQRKEAELTSYLEGAPEGCFTAVRSGRITGCVFSHIWGEVGWIGPLVVHPGLQGKGIGKQLLARATDYLLGSGVSTLGLETMPQTVYNLGLYLKQGFFPGNLRLRYGKELVREPLDIAQGTGIVRPATAVAVTALLPEVSRISEAIEPGLDYSREFRQTYRHGLGKAFFRWEGDHLTGFCLYHELAARERAIIKVMAVTPGAGSEIEFKSFLRECEIGLLAQGVTHLTIPVYGEYSQVCRWLLESGYLINNAGVRLFKLRKALPPRDLNQIIHLSQWSG